MGRDSFLSLNKASDNSLWEELWRGMTGFGGQLGRQCIELDFWGGEREGNREYLGKLKGVGCGEGDCFRTGSQSWPLGLRTERQKRKEEREGEKTLKLNGLG